jgi:hypothetical protein
MITTAFALLLLAPSARTVTYHGPVNRLDVVLSELGRQTGENLQPGAAIADLPVFLRCDNQPVADVYAHLAQAVHGRWERDSKAVRLVRDSRDITNEQREDEKTNAQFLEKALQKKREEVAKMEPFSESQATTIVRQLSALNKEYDPNRADNTFYTRTQAIEKQGPVKQALTRVVANFDAAMLASLPNGIKVVFSNRPNASQHPLPDGCQQILARSIQDQNTFAAAAKKYGLQPPQINGGSYIYTQLLQQLDSAEQVDRVWLSLFYRQGTMLQVELKMLNKKGITVMQASDYISVNGMDELGQDWFTGKPKPSDTLLKFDADRKAMIDAIAIKLEPGQTPPSTLPPLPPFAREIALNVDKDEPTKYFVTDLIDQAIPPGPVAAVIDDQMMFFTFIQRKESSLASASKLLSVFGQITTEDGWTHIRPRMMGKFMRERLSRKVQAQIIRTATAKDSFSIEDQAWMAFVNGDKEFDLLSLLFSQRLRSRMDYSIGNGNVYARLYGSLSDSQRRTAAGSGLAASNLVKPQLEILNKIIFGQNLNVNYDIEAAKAAGEKVSAETFDWSAFYNGVGNDATEIFPTGDIGTVVIKTTESTDTVLVPERVEGSNRWYGDQTAEDYATQQFYRTRPDIFTWIDRNDNPPTKFRCAKRRQLNITLVLKPGIMSSQQVNENNFIVSSPVTYSGLPADFRAQVETAMARLKEQYKDAKPGQYGAPARTGSKIPPQ